MEKKEYSQLIKSFVEKDEFIFEKNFYPGMKIKDKEEFYGSFIHFHENCLENENKLKFLKMLKYFLSKEDPLTLRKIQKNLESIINPFLSEEKTKNIITDIENIFMNNKLVCESDLAQIECKSVNNAANVTLTDLENSNLNYNSTNNNNTFNKFKTRVSLTPKGISNTIKFNNQIVTKDKENLSTVNANKTGNLFKSHTKDASKQAKNLFLPLKSNESKPISLVINPNTSNSNSKGACAISQRSILPRRGSKSHEHMDSSTNLYMNLTQEINSKNENMKMKLGINNPNTEFEVDDIKEPAIENLNDIIKVSKSNRDTRCPSNMISEEFIFEMEEENTNIFYKSNLQCQYISLNLFLKRIALDMEIEPIKEKETVKDIDTQVGKSGVYGNLKPIKKNAIDVNHAKTNTNNHILKRSPSLNNRISKLINSFLQQYSSFMSTETLFKKVESMYYVLNKQNDSISTGGSLSLPFYPGLIKFINEWIIAKYDDDFFLKGYNSKFLHFYKHLVSHPETTNHFSQYDIDSILEIFKHDSLYDVEYSIKSLIGRKKSQNITFKSESYIPSKMSDIFDVLEWSEIEIARQLTLISHHLFSKVEFKELFCSNFTKKEKFVISPNVMKIIDRFNKLSMWTIEEILSYDKKRKRAGAIEKFIKIARECRNLCNFNDCVNIICSMNNFIVKNLKKTWKVMNPEIRPVLSELNEFCSHDNNYKNIRNAMTKAVGKPCVPYLGLLLKELAFIEEGPKYIKDAYLLNIDKIKNVSNAIAFFFQHKTQAYLFRPIEQLAVLEELHPKTEEEIEELADKIEPVYTLSRLKIVKKRITNTDSKMYKLKPTYQEYLFVPKTTNEFGSKLCQVNSGANYLISFQLTSKYAIGVTTKEEVLEWKNNNSFLKAKGYSNSAISKHKLTQNRNRNRNDYSFLQTKPIYQFYRMKFSKVLVNNANNICLGLDTHGNVLVWGNNKDGLLGLGYNLSAVDHPTKLESLRNITEISLSENHAVVIDNRGTAYSWGSGKYGELGLERTIYSPFPTKISSGRCYYKVFCSELLTCFLDTNKKFSYFGVIIKIFKGSNSSITLKSLLKDESNSDPNFIFQEKTVYELASEIFTNITIGNGFIGLLSEKGLVYTLDHSDNITILYSKYFVYSISVSNNQLFGLCRDKVSLSSEIISNDDMNTHSDLNDMPNVRENENLSPSDSSTSYNFYLCRWLASFSDKDVISDSWTTHLYKISDGENMFLIDLKNKDVLMFQIFDEDKDKITRQSNSFSAGKNICINVNNNGNSGNAYMGNPFVDRNLNNNHRYFDENLDYPDAEGGIDKDYFNEADNFNLNINTIQVDDCNDENDIFLQDTNTSTNIRERANDLNEVMTFIMKFDDSYNIKYKRVRNFQGFQGARPLSNYPSITKSNELKTSSAIIQKNIERLTTPYKGKYVATGTSQGVNINVNEKTDHIRVSGISNNELFQFKTNVNDSNTDMNCTKSIKRGQVYNNRSKHRDLQLNDSDENSSISNLNNLRSPESLVRFYSDSVGYVNMKKLKEGLENDNEGNNDNDNEVSKYSQKNSVKHSAKHSKYSNNPMKTFIINSSNDLIDNSNNNFIYYNDESLNTPDCRADCKTQRDCNINHFFPVISPISAVVVNSENPFKTLPDEIICEKYLNNLVIGNGNGIGKLNSTKNNLVNKNRRPSDNTNNVSCELQSQSNCLYKRKKGGGKFNSHQNISNINLNSNNNSNPNSNYNSNHSPPFPIEDLENNDCLLQSKNRLNIMTNFRIKSKDNSIDKAGDKDIDKNEYDDQIAPNKKLTLKDLLRPNDDNNIIQYAKIEKQSNILNTSNEIFIKNSVNNLNLNKNTSGSYNDLVYTFTEEENKYGCDSSITSSNKKYNTNNILKNLTFVIPMIRKIFIRRALDGLKLTVKNNCTSFATSRTNTNTIRNTKSKNNHDRNDPVSSSNCYFVKIIFRILHSALKESKYFIYKYTLERLKYYSKINFTLKLLKNLISRFQRNKISRCFYRWIRFENFLKSFFILKSVCYKRIKNNFFFLCHFAKIYALRKKYFEEFVFGLEKKLQFKMKSIFLIELFKKSYFKKNLYSIHTHLFNVSETVIKHLKIGSFRKIKRFILTRKILMNNLNFFVKIIIENLFPSKKILFCYLVKYSTLLKKLNLLVKKKISVKIYLMKKSFRILKEICLKNDENLFINIKLKKVVKIFFYKSKMNLLKTFYKWNNNATKKTITRLQNPILNYKINDFRNKFRFTSRFPSSSNVNSFYQTGDKFDKFDKNSKLDNDRLEKYENFSRSLMFYILKSKPILDNKYNFFLRMYKLYYSQKLILFNSKCESVFYGLKSNDLNENLKLFLIKLKNYINSNKFESENDITRNIYTLQKSDTGSIHIISETNYLELKNNANANEIDKEKNNPVNNKISIVSKEPLAKKNLKNINLPLCTNFTNILITPKFKAHKNKTRIPYPDEPQTHSHSHSILPYEILQFQNKLSPQNTPGFHTIQTIQNITPKDNYFHNTQIPTDNLVITDKKNQKNFKIANNLYQYPVKKQDLINTNSINSSNCSYPSQSSHDVSKNNFFPSNNKNVDDTAIYIKLSDRTESEKFLKSDKQSMMSAANSHVSYSHNYVYYNVNNLNCFIRTVTEILLIHKSEIKFEFFMKIKLLSQLHCKNKVKIYGAKILQRIFKRRNFFFKLRFIHRMINIYNYLLENNRVTTRVVFITSANRNSN